MPKIFVALIDSNDVEIPTSKRLLELEEITLIDPLTGAAVPGYSNENRIEYKFQDKKIITDFVLYIENAVNPFLIGKLINATMCGPGITVSFPPGSLRFDGVLPPDIEVVFVKIPKKTRLELILEDMANA